MMHRLIFVVSVATALAACGDDTGGAGGSGGAGTGGSGSTTTGGEGGSGSTTTSTGGDGGGATTSVTTGAGGGGVDGAAVVEACEAYDAAAEALSAGAECEYAQTDCAATGAAFNGCEAEARDLLDCWAAETTVDDCACDDADGFVCEAPAACDAAFDALTTCTNG